MVIENLCPVCGFEMEDPPRDYNICPSCGTEFGLHDLNSSIENLRMAWLKNGARWWSAVDSQPTAWNPYVQLARVLVAYDLGHVPDQIVPVELEWPTDVQVTTDLLDQQLSVQSVDIVLSPASS